LARILCDQGLIVLVATVSPTAAIRARAKEIVGADRFVEVFCDAPLGVCEARDVDKLFARARAGTIANVTGVDQEFEAPACPDVRLDSGKGGAAENALELLAALERAGRLRSS
jgi:adenylylsulfate kinase-like enzyme